MALAPVGGNPGDGSGPLGGRGGAGVGGHAGCFVSTGGCGDGGPPNGFRQCGC